MGCDDGDAARTARLLKLFIADEPSKVGTKVFVSSNEAWTRVPGEIVRDVLRRSAFTALKDTLMAKQTVLVIGQVVILVTDPAIRYN